MTILILLVLAALWAAVLLPPYLSGGGRGADRRRGPDGLRTLGSIGGAAASRTVRPIGGRSTPPQRFAGQLIEVDDADDPEAESEVTGFASASTPAPPDQWMPRSVEQARRRRRTVLAALGGLAAVTLLAVPFLGAAALALHLLVDVALGGFGFLVYQRHQREVERFAVVRPLRPARQTVRSGVDSLPRAVGR